MDSPLNSTLEELLSSGGDTRLDIDPHTDRNRYQCLARPGSAVPFGSCTSSTVSPRGFEAAREAQQMLRASKDWRATAHDLSRTIRRRLGDLLLLPDGVAVVLGPSGTDMEMLALALAAGDGSRPVVNIVVGPTETGSGTPLAAACRHYDTRTPSGRNVRPGDPIDPALAALVDVRSVDLRTPRGDMLSESEIDAEVVELVVEAIEAEATILLHIVAHSKTGVHAPSLWCVDRLRKISEDVIVVVDAAQGRFSRRGLRDVLQKNYMVMFTGSKFYGGPPFSGALLVPPEFLPRERGISTLPPGFSDYFTAADMLEDWTDFRRALPAEPNPGLILRWIAALAEIEAYYQAPDDARLRVLRFFETEAPRILGESDTIRLLPVFPPVYDDTSERLLESKTTVFGFWVTPPGTQKPLDKAELKRIHEELVIDMSSPGLALDLELMSPTFHIGQPVELGQAGCVLRVALGGELITRVATDRALGATLDMRLEWLRRQLMGLRLKIECLAARRSPTPVATPVLGMR